MNCLRFIPIFYILWNTQGQVLHDHEDHLHAHNDIGVYNGQIVTMDDLTESRLQDLRAGLGFDRFGPRSVGGIRGGFADRSGVVIGAAGGVGIGVGAGGIGVGAGIGGIGAGVIGGSGRLRQCHRNACTFQFIPQQCSYTPVLRSLAGQYCLGCPQDICRDIIPGHGRQNRRERRRRRRQRRRQQRLCRMFGACFGSAGGLGGGRVGLGAGRFGAGAGAGGLGLGRFGAVAGGVGARLRVRAF